MKSHDDEKLTYGKLNRTVKIRLVLYGLAAALAYAKGHFAIGNFIIFLGLFMLFHRFFLYKIIEIFQFKICPAFRERYTRFLFRFLKRPWLTLIGTLGLFFLAIGFFIIRSPKVVFFPQIGRAHV